MRYIKFRNPQDLVINEKRFGVKKRKEPSVILGFLLGWKCYQVSK